MVLTSACKGLIREVPFTDPGDLCGDIEKSKEWKEGGRERSVALLTGNDGNLKIQRSRLRVINSDHI